MSITLGRIGGTSSDGVGAAAKMTPRAIRRNSMSGSSSRGFDTGQVFFDDGNVSDVEPALKRPADGAGGAVVGVFIADRSPVGGCGQFDSEQLARVVIEAQFVLGGVW